jgi:hypothetical protein
MVIDRSVLEATLAQLNERVADLEGQINTTLGAAQQTQRFLAMLDAPEPVQAAPDPGAASQPQGVPDAPAKGSNR